jgi:hypothetical protein
MTPQPTPFVDTRAVQIETAECQVFRRETQAKRIKEQADFRISHPDLAAMVEETPWYVDPTGPYGSDDFVRILIEYLPFTRPNNDIRGMQVFLPIAYLRNLKTVTIGKVRRKSASDDETTNTDDIEYSFSFQASFALSMLIFQKCVADDSVLANGDEWPIQNWMERDGVEDE